MSEFKSGDKVLAEVYIIGAARTQGEERYIVTDNDKYAAETLAIKMDRAHPIPTKTYEDGLREAWEMARRITSSSIRGGLGYDALKDIFKTTCPADVFREFTPQKAADCIALWEAQRNKINVGDVVKDPKIKNGYAIVSYVGKGSTCCVVWDDGSCGTYNKNDFVKTGRTIDIAALLAQIGGRNETD